MKVFEPLAMKMRTLCFIRALREYVYSAWWGGMDRKELAVRLRRHWRGSNRREAVNHYIHQRS
jgi:hypothetical protein